MDTNLGQVVLVKDINPNFLENNGGNNPEGSNPEDLIEFNGKLYFSADDGESGRELFVSDGTAEGTQLLVDLNPGISPPGYYRPSSVNSSAPGNFIEFNGKLYFSANDGESGSELFVSDGTAEGTQLVVDLNPGISYFSYAPPVASASNPGDFIEFNDQLYFSADDGTFGRELFVSDGTAEETQLLADINLTFRYSGSRFSTGFNYGSNPAGFTEFNDQIYFAASDRDNGRELFVSDGTAEGTQLVADLNPMIDDSFSFYLPFAYGSSPNSLIEFNDQLYFTANDGENGTAIFVSDGTTEGTQLLVDLNPDSSSLYDVRPEPYGFVEFNDKLYFTADNGEVGRELFVTDGTAEGTSLVVDLNPDSGSDPSGFTVFGEQLYFTADNGENGRELFVTDGTAEGTSLVVDLNPDSGSDPLDLTVFGDELFFSADNGEVGRELFKLTFDSTITQSLNPITGTSNSDDLVGTDSDDEIAGNNGNDGISGESGNDILLGQSGNDVLDGGAGNDTLSGGEGIDTVVYQFAPAGVSVTLSEGDRDTLGRASDGFGNTDSLSNIENVIGSEFDDNLTGNSSNNSLTGRGGNDTIIGISGDDNLTGGTGADTLSGGSGSDLFVYFNPDEGGDTIDDFVVGIDKIAAVAVGFGSGLSSGALSQDSFAVGSVATSNEQRFVFNDASGELFFDTDGAGAANSQLIATLNGVSNLSAEDIMLL